jgi:predicted transcriptional regulator
MRSPVRAHILGLVEARPGASIQDLADGTGVNRTAVVHHARRLVREGRIEAVRHGRAVLHFPAGVASTAHRSVLAALRLETACAILSALRGQPDLSWRALARRLGVTPRAIRWQVRRLAEAGLISVVKGENGAPHLTVLSAELRRALELRAEAGPPSA